MGFVDKLRNEVIMVRNITAFIEKIEAQQQLKKERMMMTNNDNGQKRNNVSVQTSM